ncbi:MAG: hypothetical protein A3D74_04935 [Candidatus Levybacteria bacterium RIFCSPHIGHO2_02_FULL_37_13]|nr:MAG: hypothetical protein A3D74_04935 [Candidatus Levybacteria bacterium RIFCSPHIGHO2_02_FULL_37_13]OGH40682.1 MAG: hypothetical protein A3B41_02995 [Candidatus Levybacteria bacterium RIFCSPLOWO2_01_FULL_37_26]
MAKEISTSALEFYRKFDTQQEAHRVYVEESKRKVKLVDGLFGQGVNILEEFGTQNKGYRGIGTQQGVSGIKVNTPLVPLEIEGKEVNLIMIGFKPNYFLPEPPRPDRYEYISVNRVGEDDRSFMIDAAYLFRIHAGGEISTPLSKVTNEPEVIEAASSLLDVIQQSLSETYPSRSLHAKPKTEKRGLSNALSRLNPLAAKRSS